MSATVKQIRYFLALARRLGIPYAAARSELERLSRDGTVSERIAELERMVRIHEDLKKDPGALRRLVLDLCRTRQLCEEALRAVRQRPDDGAH